ncbi:MAG: hypothetical protein EOP92_13755 [Lysobacteraceae bacterium]|nr:MAG: hypothetical protein EOP92_13755 [Xanthomonadaceae bacterium]
MLFMARSVRETEAKKSLQRNIQKQLLIGYPELNVGLAHALTDEPFPCVRGKVPKADGGKRICVW